jgi:hypothetical protein
LQRVLFRFEEAVLDIPWDVLHQQWKYAAKDKSGKIHVYTGKPHKRENAWRPGDEAKAINLDENVFDLDSSKFVKWEDSLCHRPGTEEQLEL